jgi:hypothetical protein
MVRRGRPLPKALSQEQVRQLLAQIHYPMDKALFLLMLRSAPASCAYRRDICLLESEAPSSAVVHYRRAKADEPLYLSPLKTQAPMRMYISRIAS